MAKTPNATAKPNVVRWAQAHIVIGQRGTGKTTFCLKKADKINQRALIFSRTRDKEFQKFEAVHYADIPVLRTGKKQRFIIDRSAFGEFKTLGKGIAAITNAISDGYKNGTLIFDDATTVFAPTYNYAAENLLADTRHMARETFLCFHTFAAVPYYIFGKFNTIILLYTNIPPSGKNWESMPNYAELLKAWRELYEFVNKDPAKNIHAHRVIFC